VSESSKEQGAPAGARRGKRVGTLIALGIVVVAGSIWGIARWRYSRTHVSTDNAQVDGHVVPVLAKVGGYVAAVQVDENQRLQRGASVVVIDDAELQVRLAEAEADLAAARAAAGTDDAPGQVEAEASVTRARRQALESRLEAARTNAERTERDLSRIRELAEKRIASSQQLDAAQTAASTTASDVSALAQEVAAARAAESAADAAGRAAEARLARAEAAVRRARLDLEYARVVAPVTGVISRASVEVGQLVQAGQPLAAVVADSAVWITANLKETETAEVRVGQPVDLEIDAYPGCAAVGTVESVSPATGSKFALLPPDNATGNFTKVVQRVPVRIAVTDGCGEGRPLRPGMSVVVHIDTH